MSYLKVTSRGSIMVTIGGVRKPLQPRTVLSREQCAEYFGTPNDTSGKREVDRLVQQGYLVLLSHQPEDPRIPELPPQITPAPPHPQDVDETQPGGGHGMTTHGKGEVPANLEPPTTTATPKVVHDTGPWNLDPATLEDKSVEELNVMIGERLAPDADPVLFADRDEAIVWLTQDFEPETEDVAVATS